MDDMNDIYRQHAQTVYKFLLSQTRDPDLAEELTQETFYQAVRSIDRFDGRCKVSVWLCQIARHLWYQHLRRTRRETPTADEDLPEVPVPSAEEGLLAQAGQLELLRQVHSLPEAQREVVYRRAFGGLSGQKKSDVMGKTETWATVTSHRRKEKLRIGGKKKKK